MLFSPWRRAAFERLNGALSIEVFCPNLIIKIINLFITDLLTAGVLTNLWQVTEYAAKHKNWFVKLLVRQNEIGGKRKIAAAIK